MKPRSKIITALALMFVVCIPLIPSYVFGWQSENSFSVISTRAKYNTHQWLAWEAVDMFPESQVSWITENLLAFWQGVEAPYNGLAAEEVGLSEDDYGNINNENVSILILDATGTVVTNDSLALLAKAQYDNLIIELAKNDVDYELAAFYAGAMSHYISQAGLYKTIWNETLWGPINLVEWVQFEGVIENGLTATYYSVPMFNYNFMDMSIYYNEFFSLTPTAIAREDAYNATINLAKQIHPLAQNIHDDFNASITDADEWEASYYDDVKNCLTWSVEATYAALSKAMHEVEWRYLTIPSPVFNYDNDTHHLSIDEFQVTYTEDSVSYVLNDSMATVAEAYYVYYDEDDNPDRLSTDKIQLEYNDITDNWYLEDDLAPYTVARANHSLVFLFDMDQAALTWSNLSSQRFYIEFFNCTINDINVYYDRNDRTLDIWNLSVTCHDLPEIGIVQGFEVTSAKWYLYEKGTGASQTGHAVGFPKYDTEGTYINGTLTFNATGNTWYSKHNDIGLVFTQTNSELYVIAQFSLIIPVGYWRESIISGTPPEFFPYLQIDSNYYFKSKDHQITISKPQIRYYEEYNETTGETSKFIDAYNIIAFSDYKNTELDYYEIVDKEIPTFISDRRDRRWKIFLFDGIQSWKTGLLNWNDTADYAAPGTSGFWYVKRVDVTNLPDNLYYLAAKIVNMNTNFTTSPWSPSSDIFEVKTKLPVLYYILPEFFLAGFIVFFGWLSWYRPRKKRLQIERERVDKLEAIYD